MTETKIAFLYKIASSLPSNISNNVQNVLKSYYLMKCKEVTKGYGLPDKHFSTAARCPHCCLEWKKGTNIKLNPIKLSKRQRKRRKHLKDRTKKGKTQAQNSLLQMNEMEKICMFCKKSVKTQILKPERIKQKAIMEKNMKNSINNRTIEKKEIGSNKAKPTKQVNDRISQNINIYSNTIEVFKLNNKNNTLASQVKEPPKIINNNKKRKDKYAGLCKMAVLAAAKLKEEKQKQHNSKLNLFLKPSL
ncbi:uncharacterized protein LOC114244290 [Bombyx mandarina]|uniref:Uncharacterized protein LOC114244290 n=1 Tax=Bombyx mandarina TaxID=7092 RepID=A0A6J2JQ51_BOMMA|nr:uncharacterized protein LOC114244290 [Bombyx mandarina]